MSVGASQVQRKPAKRTWGTLLAVLLLVGLVVGALFFALGGDIDISGDAGSVDVEAPELDVDADAPNVDVEVEPDPAGGKG